MTELLAATLSRLPAAHHGPLLRAPDATPVPFVAVRDPEWLAEQLRLRGRRWRTDDLRVLATLWWYSVSNWYVVAAATSLVATGRALSPRVDDVTLHWLPDSRVTGGTSAVELVGEDPVTALGAAIRDTLTDVLPRVAEAGQMRERPLWAIATDALANRFLWAGRAVGLDASPTATAIAAAVGAPLPRPRWADVVPVDPDGVEHPELGSSRFTRRASCCLLVEAPGQSACGSCPGRTPADRRLRLQVAAWDRAVEP